MGHSEFALSANKNKHAQNGRSLTWKDPNLGCNVEVKYMNEPCNAC